MYGQTMKGKDDLTARQQFFVAEYLTDLNATQAAIRAGYSARTAEAAASRLLRNVKVSAEIRKAVDQRALRLRLDADQVLREIARVAYANVYDYIQVQPDGTIKFNFLTLDEESAKGIAQLWIREYRVGRAHVRTTHLRLANKLRALELLAKHLGLFTDKQDGAPNSGVYAELLRVLGPERLSDAELQEVIDRLAVAHSKGVTR